MQEELEKMEEVSSRVGVSYEAAHLALEEAGGDVAEAVVIAERDRETSGSEVAAAGTVFVDEVKKLLNSGTPRALRVKFGNRLLKEISVSPQTAVAVVLLTALAVLVTKLRVEVVRSQQESMMPPASLPEFAEE